VRKTKLRPPWAVTVYELTENGRELDGVLRSLAQWGARTLGTPAPDDCWSMYAVHARFRPDAAVDGVYEIRFDGGETISLAVRSGQLTAVKLPAEEPTLVVQVAPETLHGLIEGAVSVRAAVADGRAQILVGSQTELGHLVAMFAPAEAGAAVAAA
jgi:hypothetical protein